eukprot:CAMPEP_0175167416 /NCGR_PEP_ID=MMETSP0087-20121206/28336_1 /TAXON_ID=136419 /ORGANISM="Unknown Unknown, Strain D1" /LENGTH=40 /DNA_ID= /DNA_START= /DNA_END= /DNA_ORIENTATION=
MTPQQRGLAQEQLIRTQLALEDGFYKIAMDCKQPAVVLCD